MKNHPRPASIVCSLTFLTLLTLFVRNTSAAPLGTAFTYQGRLASGGQSANGSYDLKFTLYEDASGDNFVAAPIITSAVGVTNGQFTVALDFGADVFAGSARWLEIGVRTNGGTAFATLLPRQPITATPYAIMAGTAAAVTTPPGMVLIPAGAFTMGDTLDGLPDAVPISTTVSAFYMDVNLVSWSQWQSVYFWATNHGYSFDLAGSGKAANHPAKSMMWYDAVKWCNARSEQAGLVPAYYTNAAQTEVYRAGQVAVQTNWVNWSRGYRLPTEAEWEKAARGGLSGQRFPWGNVINQNLANYYGATGSYAYDLGPNRYSPAFMNGVTPYTSPAGYFAPNGYGLYDMAGNVREWCWDWYGTPYAGGSDPRGPASGSARVLRGGDWDNGAYLCRAANRDRYNPTSISILLGFRSVLPSGQ